MIFMLKNFFITQQEVDALTQGMSPKSLWDDKKYEVWNNSLEGKLQKYIENVSGQETLKADQICNLFYPEKDIPIFISHSSKNKDVAQKLAIWFKEKLGLLSFIDSDLWGNINVIQKTLDEKHCKKENDEYDYDLRNMCTAHVHMILSYALTRMIDRADFFIFVKSDSSVSLEDSIERTNSSWIFHELVTASLIERKNHFNIFDQKKKRNLMEANLGRIPISYPIPLDGFNTLDSQVLKSIEQEYSSLNFEGASFKKYQNKAYWIAKIQKEPSNDEIAKNCLLGYKRRNFDERVSAAFG